jgi:hypothetical protein
MLTFICTETGGMVKCLDEMLARVAGDGSSATVRRDAGEMCFDRND